MKWNSKQKAHIETIFQDALDSFGLLPLTISYKYSTDKSKLDAYACFELQSQWPYRQVSLEVFPQSFKLPEEVLRQSLLHEAVHVLLSPLVNSKHLDGEAYMLVNEMVTDDLTYVLVDLLKQIKS